MFTFFTEWKTEKHSLKAEFIAFTLNGSNVKQRFDKN